MSVTFSHTAEPIISGWILECGCGEWTSSEFSDRDDAVAALSPWLNNGPVEDGCSDEFCRAYTPFVTPVYVGVEPLSANFSNVNARHLLNGLGVRDEDLCGEMDVEDFARAIALFEVTAGIPDRVTVNVGGENVTIEGNGAGLSVGRFVECGRDAGYDVRALNALLEVVKQARELHAEQITWA